MKPVEHYGLEIRKKIIIIIIIIQPLVCLKNVQYVFVMLHNPSHHDLSHFTKVYKLQNVPLLFFVHLLSSSSLV